MFDEKKFENYVEAVKGIVKGLPVEVLRKGTWSFFPYMPNMPNSIPDFSKYADFRISPTKYKAAIMRGLDNRCNLLHIKAEDWSRVEKDPNFEKWVPLSLLEAY